eukprot:TRINITY_DN16415_c0_g1_i1.p1 TRINITY_DN16415_c0_g1~~TRINITY_DN16415_c0_g1_i1.p1  ORF type:complete len:129 (+),score=8.78 TRINITY_DN16415_c0_g1_i1:199-585(+)
MLASVLVRCRHIAEQARGDDAHHDLADEVFTAATIMRLRRRVGPAAVGPLAPVVLCVPCILCAGRGDLDVESALTARPAQRRRQRSHEQAITRWSSSVSADALAKIRCERLHGNAWAVMCTLFPFKDV